MKIAYYPDTDTLRILFSQSPIEESDEDKPGVILDYDKDGNLVGLEILDASTRVENPRGLEYMVGGVGRRAVRDDEPWPVRTATRPYPAPGAVSAVGRP